MSLPHTSCWMPCSAQNSIIDRLPAAHRFAFMLPAR
jgi:hypothetical protein